jgi:ATP-dependent DNA helicase RecQ
VLHVNLPFDLESYYQEAGRGGRDGQTAFAIAFHNPADIREMREWAQTRYPTFEQVNRHFRQLCDYYQVSSDAAVPTPHPFDMLSFAEKNEESPRAVYASLQLLDREGLVALEEDIDDYGYIFLSAQPEVIYQYSQNHPAAAELIAFLLRQLGGEAYTREVRFLPNRWIEKLGWKDTARLHEGIRRLESHHLLRYRPPSDVPTLTFFAPRRTLTKAELHWERVAQLRVQFHERLEAMVAYIQDTAQCRSLHLQRYFGEKTSQPCGKCDICTGRHSSETDAEIFNKIGAALLAKLKAAGAPVAYRSLIDTLGVGSPAQREAVLREYLDQNRISSDVQGRLKLP